MLNENFYEKMFYYQRSIFRQLDKAAHAFLFRLVGNAKQSTLL